MSQRHVPYSFIFCETFACCPINRSNVRSWLRRSNSSTLLQTMYPLSCGQTTPQMEKLLTQTKLNLSYETVMLISYKILNCYSTICLTQKTMKLSSEKAPFCNSSLLVTHYLLTLDLNNESSTSYQYQETFGCAYKNWGPLLFVVTFSKIAGFKRDEIVRSNDYFNPFSRASLNCYVILRDLFFPLKIDWFNITKSFSIRQVD